jgi:hypothetical protein
LKIRGNISEGFFDFKPFKEVLNVQFLFFSLSFRFIQALRIYPSGRTELVLVREGV